MILHHWSKSASQTEMNNSELMKDKMLRQYTPSSRTISCFISRGPLCLNTVIMSVLHFSRVRRNQNLARSKPVHSHLTPLEHPSIRLRANVPELPFDHGKDVNALNRLHCFEIIPLSSYPLLHRLQL
jgi:hypothetical protein